MRQPTNWIAILVLAFCSSASPASELVIPSGNEFVEGDSNNGFPFNLASMFRYQQVYDASAFEGLSGVIEEVRFRLDTLESQSFMNVALDLEVRLSHTMVTPATLSTVFADNIGPDETLVLSGNVFLSGTTGSPTNPFDVVLDIDDTFFYNGVDNLLLDVTRTSGEIDRQLDSVQDSPGAELVQRVWTGIPTNVSGTIRGDTGLVTKFIINPVPEPTSVALVSLSCVGLLAGRRGRT